MSLALTHFLVGYTLGVVVVYGLWGEFSYLGAFASGVWAVFPDFYKLFPAGTAIGHVWEHWIHGTHLGDLCWFHYTLDGIDATNSVTALFLATWFAVVATIAVDVGTPDGTDRRPATD